MIRIEFTSGYKDEITRRSIEPLGLCFYATHWHLPAYCRLRHDYRDFRVDRIKTVRALSEKFDARRHVDLKDLISRIVFNTDLKPACVRFDREVARFVQDQKHYFGFVEETQTGDHIEMRFLTASYDHFARWLLGFMDGVAVVSPEHLKETVRQHTRRLARHHRSEAV